MFRLFYFLMTNIWAIVGVIFYIKTNEEESLNSIYKAIMIISIIICFFISFALRRGSLRIPYRQNTRQNLIQVQEPIRNFSVISSWTAKYNKPEKENCAVCCDEFIPKKKVTKLPMCGHLFHKHCIEEWVKVKPVCPICKSDLTEFFHAK